MPVYDYKCPDCGKTRTQTISLQDVDTFKAVCACGVVMVRVYGVVAVTFKGTGWGKD